MVLALVDDLARSRPVCLSRPALRRAQAAIEAGNWITAGVLLREAVRRLMFAECRYFNCLPDKARGVMSMATALRDAGQMDATGWDWITEAYALGCRAARCRPVDEHALESMISLIHMLLDQCPELVLPERQGGGAC